MDFSFNTEVSDTYKSPSQKARMMTESWVLREMYCPNCGGRLDSYHNNRPVADFHCPLCKEDFELKSKKGTIGSKVSAGAYSQMIQRISSPQSPHFFFMNYSRDFKIDNFFIVPKHFLIPAIIEERKPLSVTARRAGWIGSNILFSKIPHTGKIFYIKDGVEVDKKIVLEQWRNIEKS